VTYAAKIGRQARKVPVNDAMNRVDRQTDLIFGYCRSRGSSIG
jgi:hypothetical protein